MYAYCSTCCHFGNSRCDQTTWIPCTQWHCKCYLRRATRETDDFQQGLQQAHGLPSWLFKRLKKDWGEQTEALCQSLKQVAPLTLRVNQRYIGRDAYLANYKV